MTQKTTTLRLRGVRFKNGGSVRLLRNPNDLKVRDDMRRAAASITSGPIGRDIAGFAMLAWDKDGYVVVDYENSTQSRIPAGGVPQDAKDVLLAEVAVRWTKG